VKINSVGIENFRQFYGIQKLELSCDPEKNVTLIHAENTVGKTTLLNSILWALYEITTKKFENSDDIISHEAANEGISSSTIQVKFEDNNKFFEVSRKFLDSRNGNKLYAHKINDGNYEKIDAPQTLVNSIIPKAMAKYFFFDGEAAETFSAEGNKKEIRDAVRDILGCSFVDTAVKDLKEIKKQINREIGESADDIEVKNNEREIEKISLKIDQTKVFVEQIEEQISIATNQLGEIDVYLKEHHESEFLQKERNDFESQRARALTNLKSANSDRVGWISEYALPIVSATFANEAISFLEEANVKGVIPSPYNEEVVKDLLENMKCICGRAIEPSSPEYVNILNLLKNASNAETRSRVQRARSLSSSLIRDANKATDRLTQVFDNAARQRDIIKSIEDKLEEIGSKINDIDIEEIKKKESNRISLRRELNSLNQNVSRHRVSIEQLQSDLGRLERLQNILLTQHQLLKPLRRRLLLVSTAIDQLTDTSKRHENDARRDIMAKVNSILLATTRNNYRASLEPDFSLVFKTPDGKEVGKSGGENQILSLAFIAALVDFSKQRLELNPEEGQILIPGTIAPLVLDAPFGQLDNTYRSATVSFLPNLAEQLVLFVTSSQGGDEVRELLKDKIGAEYILIRENRSLPLGTEDQKLDRPKDEIVIDGENYIRAFYNCEKDLTRIERIR
jgi:DNA sulfur modification protein DndD